MEPPKDCSLLCRTTVGVTDLALDAAVEIDVIAVIPERTSMAGTCHIAT
ncbi:hypothetical protein [Streptomyces sp. NPDC001508]